MRTVFACFIFLISFVGFARAASVSADGATLVINGSRVLTLRTTVGNMGPKARVAMLAKNVEKSTHEGNVEIKKAGRSQQILIDGNLVLTVTKAEAARNDSTPSDLATQWARAIRKALLTPPLVIDVQSLKLPLGAAKQIPVSGSMFGALQVQSNDGAILRTEKTEKGIALKAVGYGRTEVVVTAGQIVKTIPVAVMPYAVNLPQNHVAIVTGIPATSDTVAGAIESTVQTQLSADENANLKVSLPKATQILPGESRTYTVHVRATGSNCLPSEGQVFVTVKNMALGRVAEHELWYCNEPENLKKPGLLFAAPLRPGTPARMLYHHINQTNQPLVVTVEAINNSDQPARLMVIPGDSKPDANPVLAGIQAADQFMKGWSLSSGEVVTIPAKSRLPLAMRRITRGQTMSGLCYLRLLDEGPDQLTIRTEAKLPFPLDSKWLAATQSSTPWRFVGAQRLNNVDNDPLLPSIHVYPNPFKTEEATYQVGGKFTFVRIGEKAIQRADKLDTLSGNFGVTYNIKATLENPTANATDVEMVFEASAGYSGALFYINGQFVRTPLLQPKTEAQIAKFRLEPGTTRTVEIVTLPLSGSSYPATLTIRPISTGAYAKSSLDKR